jgi:hypothetical protein
MKYETPELSALTPAINAVQAVKRLPIAPLDSDTDNEHVSAGYADWED